MAIYHFSAKVISRGAGSSAVAAAAYRSASRLQDERLDRAHDFTSKAGVVHSEVMAPEGTPEAWRDRQTLWNAVEAGEVRKDAQLAREIEFAIPRELDQTQGIELAQDFAKREFVDRGMVADLNVHWDVGPDGNPKPHAHVMLTMREAGPGGFGGKVRDWNRTELLEHWREAWGEHVNERLARLGIEQRIDHRSLKDQGLALEPQDKIGPAGARRLEHGEGLGPETAERAAEHHQIARRNGERIIQDPGVALSAITHQQATFTDHDLARFIHRHSDDKEQFDRALGAVKASPDLVALGRDGRGRERFTSREMLQVEQRLEGAAQSLAEWRDHGVGARAKGAALARGEDRGLVLSDEQRDAFDHVTGRERLSLVVGYAGSGKSAMLGVAREAWEAAGYRVRGAALSGIAAENLEGGSGIASRTLASLEHGWGQGRDALEARDVLVIDEAGLVGSRQMQRILSAAQSVGAKVVLVGDPEQLQAIEAGAAFRALTERHGAVEITDIRRQRQTWQRLATRQLATGRTDEAIGAYEAAGSVQGHDSKDQARGAVIEGWASERRLHPGASQLMLAYTRDDVAGLNALAREKLRAEGGLGAEQAVETTRGSRAFAPGDRVMFLRNERSLGVKNGTIGTVDQIDGASMGVRLDDGRKVAVDLKLYGDLDHGYATTIHKSQGVTVDRVQVLASGHMDRHAAYVALSRHREGVTLHFSREDFADRANLVRALGRERPKDMALDYAAAFAERRRIEPGPSQRGRGIFAGFKPAAPAAPVQPARGLVPRPGDEREAHRAIRGYASAVLDVQRMTKAGLPVLEHQTQALNRAAGQVAQLWPGAGGALAAVLGKSPQLLAGAAQGRTGPVLAAMKLERASPSLQRSTPARDVNLPRGPRRGPGLER